MSDAAVDPALRAAIIDAYNAYAEGIDSKNWPLVRSCFLDKVYIDYGDISVGSGAPGEPRDIEDWMAHLTSVINGFDFTQHSITNHRFHREGERIVCRAYMTADHVILSNPEVNEAGPQEITTVVGEYTNTYELVDGDWKIYRSQLDVRWSSGNTALFVEAMMRSAAQQ